MAIFFLQWSFFYSIHGSPTSSRILLHGEYGAHSHHYHDQHDDDDDDDDDDDEMMMMMMIIIIIIIIIISFVGTLLSAKCQMLPPSKKLHRVSTPPT